MSEIPKDCKILLLSEEPLQRNKMGHTVVDNEKCSSIDSPSFMTSLPEYKPKFIGLKNNIYDFKT